MTSFKDHFFSHSSGYAAYRPTYPPELVTYLAGLAPRTERAIDCGCGTGQLSVPLASPFTQVVAVDASAAQIAAAQRHERVVYRVAPADRTGEPAGGADLLTVAQAAHWFVLDRFYEEARRVLRPRGVVALITYGILDVDEDIKRLVDHFFFKVIGPYWPPEREHVNSGYRQLAFPFDEVEPPALSIDVSWTFPEFIGYIDTWSAVREAERAVGREPVINFADALARVWGAQHRRRGIRWPLSMRVGRV
jgi:SAM-dependent methyltransferase